MSRASLWLLVLALALATLTGCKRDRLVGTWVTAEPGMNAVSTFSKNNQLRMTMTVGGSVQIDTFGRWEQDGDQLKLTLQSFSIPPSLPPQVARELDAGLRPEIGQVRTFTMRWDGKDRFTLQGERRQMTYTRQN